MADKTAEEKARDTRVGNMTLEELETIIGRMIEQKKPWQRRGTPSGNLWQSMLKNIIKPAPGDPSVLDLLQEERDQWYSNT